MSKDRDYYRNLLNKKGISQKSNKPKETTHNVKRNYPITKDDVINIKIELENSKTIDQFINSI